MLEAQFQLQVRVIYQLNLQGIMHGQSPISAYSSRRPEQAALRRELKKQENIMCRHGPAQTPRYADWYSGVVGDTFMLRSLRRFVGEQTTV